MNAVEQIWADRAAERELHRKWKVWAKYEGYYTGLLYLGEFKAPDPDDFWAREDIIEAEIKTEREFVSKKYVGMIVEMESVDYIFEEITQPEYDPFHDPKSVESLEMWL
jgi:hypothetical protein